MMEAIQTELINLVIVVLTTIAGIIGAQITKYLKKKGFIAQIQNNKEMVGIVVNAVEQMYQHLDGSAKLDLAKIELVRLMNEKKIHISEVEIDILIEAMVREMNKTIKEELNK